METVQEAVRSRFRTLPADLDTLSQHRPFVLERVDHAGIVLLLGRQRNYTPLDWDRLEGIVPFLRRRPGWVPAGGTYVMEGEPDTLDEYLKDCIARQTSRWVAVVPKEAGVPRIDKGPPLRVLLTDRFREP